MPRVRAHLNRPCVFIEHACAWLRSYVCVRMCVWTSRGGELRGCGQSDALPQNREGPDPTGIEQGSLAPHTHYTPVTGRG